MACKYFVDSKLCRCAAVRGILIPSIYERNRYCRTEAFKHCPTYQAFCANGSPVSQDVYYDIWMPPKEPGERAAG